ncbi:MAG: hypothetical protein ACE5FL_01095 [Myxococcota bacterium]
MFELPSSIARRIGLFGLTLAFGMAGISHFVRPEPFVAIMPPFLPAHLALVYLSGAFEIAGAVGVIPVRTRRLAGYGLIALLFAVFPANIHMAMNADALVSQDVPLWFHYVRLPLQFVMVVWVWWATMPEPGVAAER